MTTSSSSDSSTETELPLSQDEDASFLAGQLSAEDMQLIANVDLSRLREDGALRDLTNWGSWYRENAPAANADVAAAAGGYVRRGPGQVPVALTPPPTPQDQPNVHAPGGSQKNQLQHVVDNPQYILPHPAPVPSPVRPQGDQFVTSAVNSSIPALEEWPGQLQFKVNVRLPKITGRMIPAAYDSEARKLYVDLSMAVPFGFRVKEGYDTSQLRLRALPVYSDVHHVNTPVRRCPSHRERNHESNVDAGDHIEWVIRADNCNAKYEASGATEERRSVVVPFEAPQPGAGEFVVFYKFCCMNSCIGGINRRRLQVIFTLETIAGDTLGRGSVEVKVCKCPLRDYRNDLQRQNRSVQQQKPSKRRREPSPGRPRPGVFMLDCGTEAMYNHMKVVLNSLRGSIPEIAAQEQSQPARLVSRSPISSPQEQEGDDSSGELEPPTPVERRPPVGDIKMEFV